MTSVILEGKMRLSALKAVFMRVEGLPSHTEVSLASGEILRLQKGEFVGDGLSGGAKVEVWPLSAIEEDPTVDDKWADRLREALTVLVKGEVLPNGNIRVFLPNIALHNVGIVGRLVPRENFEAPQSSTPKELIERTIPPGGVRILFRDSL